jgi:hypothetical protein
VKPSLASRRARVARVNAKRPQVRARHVSPQPERFDRLVDLLVELLDARQHSKGR